MEDRIVALTRQMAELAGHLFNETGRGRASTADCFIAAAAIKAEAKLLTDNVADFERCTEFHVCEIFSQMSGDAAGVREGRLAVSF